VPGSADQVASVVCSAAERHRHALFLDAVWEHRDSRHPKWSTRERQMLPGRNTGCARSFGLRSPVRN